jgi:hypothetical protein
MEQSHKSDRGLLNPEKLTFFVLIQLQNKIQRNQLLAFPIPEWRRIKKVNEFYEIQSHEVAFFDETMNHESGDM